MSLCFHVTFFLGWGKRAESCQLSFRGNLELEEKLHFDGCCNILNAREEVTGSILCRLCWRIAFPTWISHSECGGSCCFVSLWQRGENIPRTVVVLEVRVQSPAVCRGELSEQDACSRSYTGGV